MKVAFIIHPQQEILLPFDANGSTPNLTYQNAVRLAKAGHEVIIYAERRPGQAPEEIAMPGVTVRRLRPTHEDLLLKPLTLAERLVTLGSRPRRPLFASAFTYLGYALRVARDLRRLSCDAVHIHNYSQFVPVIRRINPDIRIILHMHCDWLVQLDPALVAPRLEQVDVIVGCGNFTTDNVRRRFPHLADRCHTVYNGVDTAHFTGYADRRDGPPRILFVGRISPEKGVHVLMDAFKRILARYPDAHLDVVGSSRLLASTYLVDLHNDPKVQALKSFYGYTFREKLDRLLISRDTSYLDHLRSQLTPAELEHVSFPGSIPHSHLVRYFQQADVLVNASFSEAFPLPPLEAMASGLPVVCTNVGGMPEAVLDGKTGLVVPSGDAERLANALLYLFEHPDACRAMGAAGRQRALNLFSWDQVAKSLMQAYSHLRPPGEPFRPAHRPVASPASVALHGDRAAPPLATTSSEDLRSMLVFAPHQDDETLGCGGTIIQRTEANADVGIVFMCDGALSHAHLIDPAELRRLRREEALRAAARLGVDASDVTFLDAPEGQLRSHAPALENRVLELLEARRPDDVFIPYRQDNHPDHEATNRLVRRVLARYGRAVTVYEYPIWFWYHWPRLSLPPQQRRALRMLRNTVRTRFGARAHRIFTHTVNVAAHLDRKRAALEEHRTQMTAFRPDVDWSTLGDVAGGAFLDLFFRDYEVFHTYRTPSPD